MSFLINPSITQRTRGNGRVSDAQVVQKLPNQYRVRFEFLYAFKKFYILSEILMINTQKASANKNAIGVFAF